MVLFNNEIVWVFVGLFICLAISSLIGYILYHCKGDIPVINNLNKRIKAWWVMCIIIVIAISIGNIGLVLLFALMSLLALRELVVLVPTHRGDHESLFWCFFIILPIQYALVYFKLYMLMVCFIPVFAFLFIPLRIALSGDTDNFLERAAKIQWITMLAIYCVSYVPALLVLNIHSFNGNDTNFIIFLMIVVQISDVLQYVFGKICGKHSIVPKLSPNKTVEGFIGGGISAGFVGMGLWWITPFTLWQAFGVSLCIVLAGFAGGLCMSAIKRDSNVKDFSNIIVGHGGMMDRLDSLSFAAPVFFYILYFFYQ